MVFDCIRTQQYRSKRNPTGKPPFYKIFKGAITIYTTIGLVLLLEERFAFITIRLQHKQRHFVYSLIRFKQRNCNKRDIDQTIIDIIIQYQSSKHLKSDESTNFFLTQPINFIKLPSLINNDLLTARLHCTKPLRSSTITP